MRSLSLPSCRPVLSLDPRVILALLAVLALYIAMVLPMTQWSERRGVFDDLCYLRQAQLFRDHGLIGGLDTRIRDESAAYPPTAAVRAGRSGDAGPHHD